MTIDNEMLGQIISRYKGAYFTVNRRLNAMIRERMPDGLTVDQYSTLLCLRESGVSTTSELADTFCVGKSSITAIIQRLFDKQLIVRQADEHDRRVTLLTLTEEGMHITDQIEGSIQELIATFMNQFDEQEAMAFIETFEKLAKAMAQSMETERS